MTDPESHPGEKRERCYTGSAGSAGSAGSTSLWVDRLTALVEPVDAGDVVGAHLAGPQDSVRVILSNESRPAVSGEGEPWREKMTLLVLSCVFMCDGRVKPTCCNA